MRARRFLIGGTLAAAFVVATVAFAQPRGRSAPHATSKPKADAGADNPYQDSAGSTSSAGSATVGAPSALGDAGPVPAPPQAETADGRKLSPLTPAANEFTDAGPSASTVDYDRLLADIGSLRARVAAVSDALFHSRIAVSVETSGDHGRIAAMTVSLDDGTVWTSPASFRADDATTVYDHAVAPGHHAVTVEVERRDDRNDAFRSTQRSRFIVDVPADQRLGVELKLWDDSDMGSDFPADKKGSYDLRVRMRAKTQAPGR